MTYNRCLKGLDSSIIDPTKLYGVSTYKIWVAGAIGGLASWVVSAPSELIKCRTQLHEGRKANSLIILKHVWKGHGLQGLYLGGLVTSVRDSVGYGFYFSSYEMCRRLLASQSTRLGPAATDVNILVSGGVAGIVTWASIYPLDVIKTRIQVAGWREGRAGRDPTWRSRSLAIARDIFRSGGYRAFYRGMTVCSVRAFIVNAIQVLHPPSCLSIHRLTPRSGTPMKRSWECSHPPTAHSSPSPAKPVTEPRS